MNILLTALAGLAGVLVGGWLAFALDLWRVVLASKAAARVVHFEIQANVNRCALTICAKRSELRLSDAAWLRHREQLVHVLPQEAYFQMSTAYDALPLVQKRIDSITTQFDLGKSELEAWSKQMLRDGALLLQIEERRRLPQMIDLLLGRPTFPTGKLKGPAPEIALPDLNRVSPLPEKNARQSATGFAPAESTARGEQPS